MSPKSKSINYIPALDGLKAVCIAAILIFHAGLSWLPGGFLGIEVFFVISGYLITSLLLSDYRRHRRLRLSDFWGQRLRRLTPAMYTMIAGVVLLSAIVARETLVGLKNDIPSALTYLTNWHLIASDQSYFSELSRPSLLQNLWAVAVEAQFYIGWAILLVFVLRFKKINRRKFILWLCLILAVASQLLAWVYSVHYGQERAYFGTDSRLTGLMLGAALARYLRPEVLAEVKLRASSDRLIRNGLAFFALGVILATFLLVRTYSAWPYRGGFLILDICVCLLMVTIMIPGGVVGRILALAPIVWLGTRAYSIYLWHWPIFQLMRPGIDIHGSRFTDNLLRIGLTLVIAEFSYRLIEQPLRRRYVFNRQTWWNIFLRPIVIVLCLVIALGFVFRPSLYAGGQWLPAEYIRLQRVTDGELGGLKSVSILSTSTQPAADQAADTSAEAPLTAQRPTGLITIVGDSVILGAGQTIMKKVEDPVLLNAAADRQPAQLTETLKKLEDNGQLGPTVVIGLGWNGLLTSAQIDEAMEIAGPNRLVIWLTPSGDKPWIGDSAKNIRSQTAKHPRAVIAPWDIFANNHPDWFVKDGIHVQGDGIKALAEIINRSVRNPTLAR